MSNEVFANGNEIACKSGDGKVIAAFPDVCLSPPSPPAGPIPVPYPNTSFSKDMKSGSKSVKIDKKEVMLKDKSFYKTSPLGNEAATKTLGAGVVSHVITGKTYFVAWSMDVKFEGQNVDRHIDLTTSNHASPMGNSNIQAEGEGSSPSAVDEENKKCPCCNGEKHANQKDAEVVSEKDWYGPDGYAAVIKARKLGCECVPSKPDEGCGTYYKQPDPKKSQRARNRWNGRYKKDFINRWNAAGKEPALVYESDPKKEGDKVAHKTPISAGGCIKGDKNLMPNRAMSKPCQDMDDELSEHHAARAMHFQA